jgi:hypothetical protein
MKSNKFFSPDQAAKKFGIRKGEFLAWTSVCQQMVRIGGRLCRQAQSNPSDNDWFGMYNQSTDHTPQFVIQRKFVQFPPIVFQRYLSTTVEEYFTIRSHSRSLSHLHAVDYDAEVFRIAGYLVRVRVVVATRGQRKLPVLFFYGRISDLLLDPNRLRWKDQTSILEYSTRKGRDFLCQRHTRLSWRRPSGT